MYDIRYGIWEREKQQHKDNIRIASSIALMGQLGLVQAQVEFQNEKSN